MEQEKKKIDLRSSGLFHRKKVTFQAKYGDVTLKEFSNINVDGAQALVEGFPALSLTSILAASYLREQLDLPLVGIISSPSFPPRCIIEKGYPVHPIRIFGNTKIVVCLCEFKITTSELTYSVVSALIEFAQRHRIKMIVTVEGLPMEQFEANKSDNKLAFVSTSEAFTTKMTELKHEPLNDAVITGVTGLMLAETALTDVDVSCLIAPTAVRYPDASSAVTVVAALSAFLTEVEIDTAPLQTKATQLQEGVTKVLQSEKESHANPMYL